MAAPLSFSSRIRGTLYGLAIGDTLAVQPGQMGNRLHYVMCHAGSEGGVSDIRHSVFGLSALDLRAPCSPSP